MDLFFPLAKILISTEKALPYSCKEVPERGLGVLVNLYSGTSKRFATLFPSVLQKSLQVI
jgi:hypothetical protein